MVQRLETELPLIEKDVQDKIKLKEETGNRVGELEKELYEIGTAKQLLAATRPSYEEYCSKTRLNEIEPSVERY